MVRRLHEKKISAEMLRCLDLFFILGFLLQAGSFPLRRREGIGEFPSNFRREILVPEQLQRLNLTNGNHQKNDPDGDQKHESLGSKSPAIYESKRSSREKRFTIYHDAVEEENERRIITSLEKNWYRLRDDENAGDPEDEEAAEKTASDVEAGETEKSKDPEKSKGPENAEESEKPEVPGTPGESEKPEESAKAEEPETPGESESPEKPEKPEVTEKPEAIQSFEMETTTSEVPEGEIVFEYEWELIIKPDDVWSFISSLGEIFAYAGDYILSLIFGHYMRGLDHWSMDERFDAAVDKLVEAFGGDREKAASAVSEKIREQLGRSYETELVKLLKGLRDTVKL